MDLGFEGLSSLLRFPFVVSCVFIRFMFLKNTLFSSNLSKTDFGFCFYNVNEILTWSFFPSLPD